jgi:hypothetical protein
VRGEKVPNTIDLSPKLQKLPRPHMPQRRVVATCSCIDGGVELEHDGESLGVAHARGGPQCHRSTSQDARQSINHVDRRVAAIHRNQHDS